MRKKKRPPNLEEIDAKNYRRLSDSFHWVRWNYGNQSNGEGRCYSVDHGIV